MGRTSSQDQILQVTGSRQPLGTCAGYAHAAGEGALATDDVQVGPWVEKNPQKTCRTLQNLGETTPKNPSTFILRPSKVEEWRFANTSLKEQLPNWILFQKLQKVGWKKHSIPGFEAPPVVQKTMKIDKLPYPYWELSWKIHHLTHSKSTE